MKSTPRIGATGEQHFVVEARHCIDFAEGGMPAVLCTPWLVWFLEHAAREAVLPFLEPGESTVGIELEVRHLRPTPIGEKVVCLARIVSADETRISLQIEARDEHEGIAKGFHRLQIIQVDRFARLVQRKSSNL